MNTSGKKTTDQFFVHRTKTEIYIYIYTRYMYKNI